LTCRIHASRQNPLEILALVIKNWGDAAVQLRVGFSHFTRGDGLTGALAGILTIGALFTIIVLDKPGHALAARRYGIPTHDITLLLGLFGLFSHNPFLIFIALSAGTESATDSLVFHIKSCRIWELQTIERFCDHSRTSSAGTT
jgi:putative lipase involved disintegration of autophagic bodies